MYRVVLIIVMLGTTATAIAQEAAILPARLNLAGNPKYIEFERVYSVANGRYIGERRDRILTQTYDVRRRVLEEVVYGVGYSRTVYSYDANTIRAEILYFDAGGRRTETFKPNVDVVNEAGLCSEYTVREEKDPLAKINRQYEMCVDGSRRAMTVDELDTAGEIVRSVRTDAKSRSWESNYQYDSSGNLTQFRYTVSPVTEKPYTHTVNFSDYKFDIKGNWIRMTATSFFSKRPGELIYQYNEVRQIAYHDDAPRGEKISAPPNIPCVISASLTP